MSTEQLSAFSFVVLALVGEHGASPHDIASMMSRSGVYWSSAPSQWYAEPKRLESLGHLRSKKLPGKTKQRTHYTMTASGRRALTEWLASPAKFPRIQNEAAIRLLAGDMIGDETIVASLRGMLPELEQLQAMLDDVIQRASTVPHRAKYLLLSHSWVRRQIELHRDWIAEVETALAARPPRTRSSRDS